MERSFRRYQLPLYVYVFELARDEQTSLDIVQETFIAAVRHIGSLRDDAKFGGWLFGIAHQKCLANLAPAEPRRRLREEIGEAPPYLDDGPDELLIRREQEAEFMKLVNRFPRRNAPCCCSILWRIFRWNKSPKSPRHTPAR